MLPISVRAGLASVPFAASIAKFPTLSLPMSPMTKFIQRGGLWVLSQALLLLAAIFLGLRFRGKRRPPSLRNFRWDSAGCRREYRTRGRVRTRQDHYPLPRTVGTSPIGPKWHILGGETPDLCGIGGCVDGLGPILAKLAGSADGLGALPLPRRQSPARRRMAPGKIPRIPRIRGKRQKICPGDLLKPKPAGSNNRGPQTGS